jgi:hypothetical protein
MFVPIIPELISTLELEELKISNNPKQLKKNPNISDKASALFNISYAFGAAIAPVIGGALSDKIGF